MPRKLNIFILGIFLYLFFSSVSLIFAVNQLQNGDFENGQNNWSGDGIKSFSVSDGGKETTAHSALISTDSSTFVSYLIQLIEGVNPNKLYKINGWIKKRK